jgi:hypothetical protein
MSRRLVKTIRATQVGVDSEPWSGAQLSAGEKVRLASVIERHQSLIELRQAGISAAQAERLEFLRWLVERGEVGPG